MSESKLPTEALFIFDLETTGLDTMVDGPVQVGALCCVMNGEKMNKKRRGRSRYRP